LALVGKAFGLISACSSPGRPLFAQTSHRQPDWEKLKEDGWDEEVVSAMKFQFDSNQVLQREVDELKSNQHAGAQQQEQVRQQEAKNDPDEYARCNQSDFLASISHDRERLDFHSLRHTCGAWLASTGAHPKVV